MARADATRMFGWLNPLKKDFFGPAQKPTPPAGPAKGPAPAKDPNAAPGSADPQSLLNLFAGMLPHEDHTDHAQAPAPAPAPAADPKAAAEHKAYVEQLAANARSLEAMGGDRNTFMASFDPGLQKEVSAHLAQEDHDQKLDAFVRSSLNMDKMGIGHDGMTASLSAEDKKAVEERVAEHEKLDTLAAGQRAMAAMGVPEEARLAGITDEKLKKDLQHHMAVDDLVSAGHGEKFNEKRVTELLEKMNDPDERQRVIADYEKETGTTLRHDIVQNTDEDSHYRKATDQLMSKERADAERKLAALPPEEREAKHKMALEKARKLAGELSKTKPDKKQIFDTLEFTADPADAEAIRQAFNEVAPEMNGLMNCIDHSLSGDDEREAIAGLDMSDKRRTIQAAAKMRNSFTGRFHDNDRARMKETLEQLKPEEIAEMKAHPDQYGDIMNDVQETMHGADRAVVDAYLDGNKALAEGRQLAEDIDGNLSHIANSADCDKIDMKPLFSKLEKMDPDERQKAMAAYDADQRNKAIERGDDPTEAATIQKLMDKRFDDYDKDRGDALLKGDIVSAKAAEAEDAIDRKGTHIDDLEEALSDPDLSSPDKAKQKAAWDRRNAIQEKIKSYGKGTLEEQVNDEDKLQKGRDKRAAYEDIMATGKVSFAMKMQRAIDDDDTEKAKGLMLNASKDELAEARRRFPTFADKKDFDEAVKLEWGPTKLEGSGPGELKEVIDESGDKSGNYIQMKAVLDNGPRSSWLPKDRAKVDKEAYDADRDSPSWDELTGQSWAGKHLDYSIKAEVKAAEEGATGEEFGIKAENTESASDAYAAQKEAETESLVESLKLAITVACTLLAPELLPLVTPLMSLGAIVYKENKLGKHYKGENADIKGLVIDSALSIASVGGEALIEARMANSVREGKAALGVVEESKAGVAAVEDVSTATKAADEAKALRSEATVAEKEGREAEKVAEEAKAGSSEAKTAESQKAKQELEEKAKEVEEKAKEAAEKQKLALKATTTAGDKISRGEVEGKSFTDIMKSVVLGELSIGAEELAASGIGKALDKTKTFADGANAIGKETLVALGKTAATTPIEAVAKGASSIGDVLDIFKESALTNVAGGLHTGVKAELHKSTPKDAAEVTKPAGQEHGNEGAEHVETKAKPAHEEEAPPKSAEEAKSRAKEEMESPAVPAGPRDEEVAKIHAAADEAKGQNGGVLSVEMARKLQARGAELGIPADKLPRASSPEEILLAKGMTPEEMELYKSALNCDQQSNVGDAEVKEMAGSRLKYDDSHRKDIKGEDRKALTLEQLDAVLKANCLQYEDYVEGATMAKVVPQSKVGELLYGKTVWNGQESGTKLTGDVGLARNTEGMSAEDKVRVLGLDYQSGGEHPYVTGTGAQKQVRDDVKQRLFQVEQSLTGEGTEAAKVVLGVDMYDHALMQAHLVAEARAKDPSVKVPRLLELDEHGNLKHIAEPRVRDNAESPSTGFGFTASMGLRDEQGKMFFQPNQELTLSAPQSFENGAQLTTIGPGGERLVVAVYDKKEGRFVPTAEAPADFEAMRASQEKWVNEKMAGAQP